MTGRVLVLLLVFGGIMIGGWAVRAWARRRQRQAVGTLDLPVDPAGGVRIISFYGPSCDACERQKVVLSHLGAERSASLSVELRDATVDYDYGRQFGLVIVPTTVVIRPDGRLAGINSGFASRDVLEAQLDAA